MANPIEQARQEGYTDEEINSFLAPKITDALAQGYTREEINKHLGITTPPPFNDGAVASTIRRNLDAAPKPVTSFADALEAGWGISVTGLAAAGKMPDKTLSENAPWASRIANQAAMLAGDLPAMIGGAAVGTGLGAETGPGAAITGTAGAFALPAALRSTLIDAYQKGQFTTFDDAWPRVAGIFLDTMKGYVTGAATGVAGVGARALAEGAAPLVQGIAGTGAELATMVTVGKALEGHVPAMRDFLDAAVLLGGAKVAHVTATRLMDLYVQTGVPPKQVIEDSQRDVTITQDLAMGEEIPRAYRDMVQPAISEAAPSRGESAREGEIVTEPAETTPASPTTEAPLAAGEPPKPPVPPTDAAAPTPPGEPPPTRTLEQAQDIVRQHISIGEQPEIGRMTWDRLYTMAVDKLHPIDTAVREASRALGETIPETADNPYRLGRLLAGVSGKADAFLRFGTRDFNTGEINGQSLRAVLEPVIKDLDEFRIYATSKRALELEERGIATGFDLDAARQVVDGAAGKPEYAEALTNLLAFQNRTAAYLRESGVLSRDGYNAMVEANKLYVPFQRVMDEGSPIGIRAGGNTMQSSNPIKKIEGSERVVVDPLESIIRNTYLFTQMAERNNVGVKLVDLLKRANGGDELRQEVTPSPSSRAVVDELRAEGLPDAEALEPLVSGTAAPTRPDEIRIFRDGKAETYGVTRDLAEAFKGLDVESVNLILRIASAPARALRAGATLTPDFMSRNLVRDFMTAFTNTTKGVFTPADTIRGLLGAIRKDKDWQDWMANGGANSMLVSLDRDYLQTNLRQLTEETGLGDRAWNVIRHPVDALRAISELSEEATRLGVFKKEMRAAEGKEDFDPLRAAQDAAYVSRESTLDFARIGSKMRAMNMITAFFNAQVQGVDRMVRQAAENPVSMGLRVAAGITLPSVLLWYANHDDPRYREIPNWQRDLFWIVMTKDNIYRIPKPFELGVMFGSGVERALDAFFTDKPRAFKDFANSITGALMPGFVPTGAVPIVEQFSNRSTFTGRGLVPASLEKQLPEYQYTPYTTETAKALGQLLGAFPGMRDQSLEQTGGGGVARAITSPILLENYLRAWTGGLGMYALQAADAGLRKAGVVPDPPKPAGTLADVPVVRAFMVRFPTASAQSIQDFQDNYTKNQAYFLTFMAKAQEGDVTAMRRIQQAGGMAPFMQLTGINTALNEQSKLVRDIDKNPNISPDQKRQLIDTTYWRMIEISRAGNRAMAKIEQAISAPAPRALETVQ